MTIHEPNGKDFVLEAANNNDVNRYIDSASLDGKSLHGSELIHEEIVAGSTLRLTMPDKPDPKALK